MVVTITKAPTHMAAHSTAEIDLELFTFVERYATNLFRWDLILLFGKHPEADWTAAEVAARVNRGVFATTKELDDLTYLRVLVRRYTPDRTSYRLTKRVALRRAATQLAALEHAPSFAPVA